MMELNKRLVRNCVAKYRLCEFFSVEAAKSYYYSFVYSILNYNIVVYERNLTNALTIDKTQKYQNEIVLTLFGKFFKIDNIKFNFISNSHMLKVADIYI